MKDSFRLAALALILAIPLAAQQPSGGPGAAGAPGAGERHHGMPGMGRHGMGPGRGDMAYAPSRLLARNAELQLTAQQIVALTAVRDAARKSAQTAMEQSHRQMDELRAALDANTPDTAAVRSRFLAVHESMGQAHLAMLIASARAKALLTDAQRSQVAAWKERHSHDGRRWGGHRSDGAGAPPSEMGR